MSDLKIFFEKYFIYDRSEFQRIASFIPQKTTKDVVDLFYTIKKRINLNHYKKLVITQSSNGGAWGLSTYVQELAQEIL